MRYASFDIGEKNFAYFIAHAKEEKLTAERIENHNILEDKQKQTIVQSCMKISQLLDIEPLFKGCHIILIEQQIRANVRAQRLGQHVWTYFYTKYPDIEIHMIQARTKTQYFLGKNTLTGKQRKNWAVEKITFLLNESEIISFNTDIKNYFHQLEKKDDVSDAVLQLVAYLKIKNI
jgi:hypothetical protein